MPDLFICSLGVPLYVPRCDLSAGTTGRDTRTYTYVMCTGRSASGLRIVRAGLHPLDGETATHSPRWKKIRNTRGDSNRNAASIIWSAFSPSSFFERCIFAKLFCHEGLVARLSASSYIYSNAKRNICGRLPNVSLCSRLRKIHTITYLLWYKRHIFILWICFRNWNQLYYNLATHVIFTNASKMKRETFSSIVHVIGVFPVSRHRAERFASLCRFEDPLKLHRYKFPIFAKLPLDEKTTESHARTSREVAQFREKPNGIRSFALRMQIRCVCTYILRTHAGSVAALRASTSPAVSVARERNENTRVRRPAALMNAEN